MVFHTFIRPFANVKITRMHEESKKMAWLNLKALLIARFRTITAAARVVGCTPHGLRCAAEGTCPGILKKLRAAGIFTINPTPES
jgi:hypothetical protein